MATLKTYPVLPLRTYDKFDVDPMFVIANAFSKLRKVGEGAALQVVIGPAESSFGKKIKKTAEEIRKGEKLSEALKKAKITGTGVFLSSAILFFSASSSNKDGSEKKKKQEKEKSG